MPRPRLVPRQTPSRWMALLAPLIAALATLLSGAILFAALGRDPLQALWVFFVSPVSSWYGLGELGIKAAPLILCATGLAVGFRGGVWNIGAEGQLTLGAIAGGGLALAFPDGAGPWLLPAMLLAGVLGGMLWAAIPAFLRTRFHTNEILTSLMLSYVAVQLLGYLVHGPWRSPEGYNFPESMLFSADATLPIILSGTRLHPGILAALVAALLAWLLMARLFPGYRIKVVGMARPAAAYAGFSHARIVWWGMLVGGGLAGLAGVMEVAGPIGQLIPRISPGYGFAAIIVAFLGRLHPVGVILAGLLMALLYLGGEQAQIGLGLPPAVTGLFQGMLLFFVLASDVFIHFRLVWGPLAPRAKS